MYSFPFAISFKRQILCFNKSILLRLCLAVSSARRNQSVIGNDAKEEGRDIRAANLPRDNDTKHIVHPSVLDAASGEPREIVSKMGAVENIKGAASRYTTVAASQQEADEKAYEGDENEAGKSAAELKPSALGKTVQLKESPAKDSPLAVDSLNKKPSEPLVAKNDASNPSADDQDGGRDVGLDKGASLSRGVKLGAGKEEVSFSFILSLPNNLKYGSAE